MRWIALVLCALGSTGLYLWLAGLSAGVASAEPTHAAEVFPWVAPVTHDTVAAIHGRTGGFGYSGQFLVCCAGLFVLYGILCGAARGMRSGFAVCAAGASSVFMMILLCAPAMYSSDTFAYAWYGRLLAVYGVDAHAQPPVASLADRFLDHGWYQFVPSVYGPLWTVNSAGLDLLGHGQVGLTIFLFRLFEAVCVLGAGGVLWLILQRIRPQAASFGTLLFLWNPLVIIESALGGHNDACMMLLAVAALWLHLRRSPLGAVLALTLSALVKIVTAPLIPLYLLMVLRQNANAGTRLKFIARSGIAIVAAVALSMFAGRMNPTALVARTAGSPGFYKNNYHELIFKELRRLFGEHADTLDAPMDFQTWWVTTSAPADLHADISLASPVRAQLQPGEPLLGLSDKDSRQFLRAYLPSQHVVGFVEWTTLYPIAEPANAQNDPVIKSLSVSPQDWPTVVAANRWIRYTTWSLFALFGLAAALRVRDFDSFLNWSTAFFIVALLLVFTRIWPWYGLWPLAFAAVTPAAPRALLAVLMSAGLTTSYALMGCCNTRLEWLYDYRSLFTIVLPVLLALLLRPLFRSSTASR
jgi:hypothetical protein